MFPIVIPACAKCQRFLRFGSSCDADELTPHILYHWPPLAATSLRVVVAASEDVASHVPPLVDRPLVSPEKRIDRR